jgi:hypothetical protein
VPEDDLRTSCAIRWGCAGRPRNFCAINIPAALRLAAFVPPRRFDSTELCVSAVLDAGKIGREVLVATESR